MHTARKLRGRSSADGRASEAEPNCKLQKYPESHSQPSRIAITCHRQQDTRVLTMRL
jgi:hypothetical protein